jgi:CheY-like chemotaxis protein
MVKILIVGYDPLQRSRLKEILEAVGYRVAVAADAIHGLIAATRYPPDLIVSEVLMQRMDGFTFLRVMKSRADLRQIPFVFGPSTVISEEERQFAQMLGAEAILDRVEDSNSLLAAIAACLRRQVRISLGITAKSGEANGLEVEACPNQVSHPFRTHIQALYVE